MRRQPQNTTKVVHAPDDIWCVFVLLSCLSCRCIYMRRFQGYATLLFLRGVLLRCTRRHLPFVFCCVFSSSGRVLELLVLLNDHWQKHRLGSYKLVLLHNTAFNTAEFAKSQVSCVFVKSYMKLCGCGGRATFVRRRTILDTPIGTMAKHVVSWLDKHNLLQHVHERCPWTRCTVSLGIAHEATSRRLVAGDDHEGKITHDMT